METSEVGVARSDSERLLTEQDLRRPIEPKFIELARDMLIVAGADLAEIPDKSQALGCYLQKGAQSSTEVSVGGDMDEFYDAVAGRIRQGTLLPQLAADYAQLRQSGALAEQPTGVWDRIIARRRPREEVALGTRKDELEELHRVATADGKIRLLDLRQDDIVTFHAATQDNLVKVEITARILKFNKDRNKTDVVLEVEHENRSPVADNQKFKNPMMRKGEKVKFQPGLVKLGREGHYLALSDRLSFYLCDSDVFPWREPTLSNGENEQEFLRLRQLTINGIDIFSQAS